MSFKTDSISKSKKREVAKEKTKKSQIPFIQFDPKYHNLLKIYIYQFVRSLDPLDKN